MRTVLSRLLQSALLCTAAASAAAAPFRLALVELSLPRDQILVQATVEKGLAGIFPDGLEITSWRYEDLDRMLRDGKADAILGTAGQLTRLTNVPLRPLATIIHSASEDPNRNEGTAIVVRKDRSDLKTLSDLKGKSISANSPLGFAGYMIALGEVAKFSADPEHFFSSVDFQRDARATENIAQSVLSGKTDAGFLRLCALEDFEAAHPEVRGELRVINRRTDSLLSCVHSTDLYPGFTLAVTSSVEPEVARRITIGLLSMPPTASGTQWSLPTDLSGLNDLYRLLKAGPYAYLSVWSLEGFVKRYFFWFLAAFAAVAALGLHSWRSHVLLERRDRDIRSDLAKLTELQQKTTAAVVTKACADRLTTPLASAVQSAISLQNRVAESDVPAPLAALAQSAVSDTRAALARVRGLAALADLPAGEHALLDVGQLLQKALVLATPCFTPAMKLTTDLTREKLTISGNARELQLLLVYLLRNAARAAGSSETIHLACRRERDLVTILIRDDAPVTDDLSSDPAIDETAPSLTPPALRLAVARRIIAHHHGVFSLTENPVAEGGVTATLSLPLV